MPVCATCKVGYMEGESHVCGGDRHWRTKGVAQGTPQQGAITPATAGRFLTDRYRDGYRGGKFISTLGHVVKIVGGVLALIVAIGGVASSRDVGMFSTSLAAGSILVAVTIALGFFVLGVVISAQGQLILAVLDTAVNSSPFLTDDQRTQVMF